ncbi:MAG: UDP-N-acetylglucosamine 2-epimerase (non-hydrolyzing) [Ignavibacteria bacterium]|nr:UDP-N-acetylglucosamine 2-epimerase (non-hydrolyzing) [Ignavibacteria bacterium]
MEIQKISKEDYKNKKVIVIVFGTRPEIIKLFILHRILKESEEFYPVLYNTAQQKISSDILQHLNIEVDITGNILPDRSPDLNQFISHLLTDFNEKFNSKNAIIDKKDIAGVIVQGDTASAYTGAIWAFMNQIPVFHVEAGLRTHDQNNPFPEEFFRESIARTASLNFCPTHISYENLIKEGITPKKNYIVGNTINDAIIHLMNNKKIKETNQSNYILSTLHRRENWNHVTEYAKILFNVLNNDIRDKNVLHIIHPNPLVKEGFHKVFKKYIPENLIIKEPIHDYFEMLGIVKNSNIILTDSGGLQEESLFFKIPCGIMRKVTERPEVLERNAKLLPFDKNRVREFLLESEKFKVKDNSPFDYTYGDGTTSYQIYEILKRFFRV